MAAPSVRRTLSAGSSRDETQQEVRRTGSHAGVEFTEDNAGVCGYLSSTSSCFSAQAGRKELRGKGFTSNLALCRASLVRERKISQLETKTTCRLHSLVLLHIPPKWTQLSWGLSTHRWIKDGDHTRVEASIIVLSSSRMLFLHPRAAGAATRKKNPE
jgi:hypothetical protein